MSALGQKQTFVPQKVMSALPPTGHVGATRHVRFGPKADLADQQPHDILDAALASIPRRRNSPSLYRVIASDHSHLSQSMRRMISKADAIIIGSGALGAATAYYLSRRKRLSIVLIDKHDIGSQTSPRAAGMVSCARKSDLMISLLKDACRKIEAFTEETGQPLDWVHSGSLKIARRPQDAEVVKDDFERGRRMGLDMELISPEQASRLNPFLKPTGVVAAMRIGDDRYFDPAQVAVGYASAAAAQGATLVPKTGVLAVNINAGRVAGVTTAKGSIEGPIVVDAAGAWLGAHFDIKDMPLDIEVLHSAAAEVKDQLPILKTAQVREFRGGIPTMTADGHHILGPAPGVEGFYFASGCNVAGLSISPAVGEVLATWIFDGKPSVDLSPMSCMRFKDKSWSEAQLQRDAAWQYRHFYGAV
jgi:glycine/D-amino acid oxidase-like deaminating enzyme